MKEKKEKKEIKLKINQSINQSVSQSINQSINQYSRTSRKRPPKMSSLGGRLREVVAYQSLDHIGLKFCLVSIW